MCLKPKVGLHNKRNFEKSRNYSNEYCVHFTRFSATYDIFFRRFVSDWLLTSIYHIYIRGVIDSVVTIFITGGFLFYVMLMSFKMIKIPRHMIRPQ